MFLSTAGALLCTLAARSFVLTLLIRRLSQISSQLTLFCACSCKTDIGCAYVLVFWIVHEIRIHCIGAILTHSRRRCVELLEKPVNPAVLTSSSLFKVPHQADCRVIFLSLSCVSALQARSSRCWRSCCLSPRSRTIPAGWSSRRRTAAPAKFGSWCRSTPTRSVRRCSPSPQSAAFRAGSEAGEWEETSLFRMHFYIHGIF